MSYYYFASGGEGEIWRHQYKKIAFKKFHKNSSRKINFTHGRGQVKLWKGMVFEKFPWIEGQDFKEFCLQEASVEKRLRVFASAVENYILECSRRGVMFHGDISPDNLIVTKSSAIWIDWRLNTDAEDLVAYKIAFVAPEKFVTALDSVKSEIFSLGLLLYLALSGETLFSRDRLQNEKELREFSLAFLEKRTELVDRGWRALLLRCLSPYPWQRFDSCRDLLRDLECHL